MDEFFMPFGGKLSADNRWVKIAKLMPWDMVEDLYASTFKDEKPDGRPPIPARIAFGAIYIKEQETITDERTVEHIAENPYMQYFLGLSKFQQEPLFDPSMMTHFRKRFSAEMIAKINEELYRRMNPPKPPEDGNNDGTMILDATAAPSDIRYPTDLSLLNECRENTEQMIDELWESTDRSGHKTAYNRKKARAKYLAVAKQRKPRKNKIKQAVREQLEYVRKNLETIDRLIAESGKPMIPKRLSRLDTIREVAMQQQVMLESRNHTVEARIVSLRQPHIRPIVRGKARSPVEFGQKLAFSVINGFTFIDGQSWDNFNEGVTLIESAEKYKARHGVYPSAILADTAYRNRRNRNFCKSNGIRLSGPRLGRPKHEEKEADGEQAYRDSCERNMVESRNGISKRRYGLNLIMATLSCTAQTEAALNVLAMNVCHVLRILLRLLFLFRFNRNFCPKKIVWAD
jgi:transposase, IS5 family